MILKAPRKHYLTINEKETNCPECNSPLISENSTILLYAKSTKDECQFVTNLSASKFCTKCPIVVFDKNKLEEAARLIIRKGKNIEYSVLGIVDLDATEKQENDLPKNIDIPKTPQIASNNIGRNEFCPCGSGKKYKKCCIKKETNP